jgi:hypothetical protein
MDDNDFISAFMDYAKAKRKGWIEYDKEKMLAALKVHDLSIERMARLDEAKNALKEWKQPDGEINNHLYERIKKLEE